MRLRGRGGCTGHAAHDLRGRDEAASAELASTLSELGQIRLDQLAAGRLTKHLDAAGCEVHLVPNRKPINKLHHKMMTMDDRTLVIGSFNYTGPANALNDENPSTVSSDVLKFVASTSASNSASDK